MIFSYTVCVFLRGVPVTCIYWRIKSRPLQKWKRRRTWASKSVLDHWVHGYVMKMTLSFHFTFFMFYEASKCDDPLQGMEKVTEQANTQPWAGCENYSIRDIFIITLLQLNQNESSINCIFPVTSTKTGNFRKKSSIHFGHSKDQRIWCNFSCKRSNFHF